ncbi:MAG TPA: serine hydrolase domain-containing protein [Cyclobacteriaceae bacterium]|nr:serine hydrolase domain-containing protein [Cyclobacteriaceae bacterium]
MSRYFLFLSLFVSQSILAQTKIFPSDEKVKAAMDDAMTQSDLPAVVAIAINIKGQRIDYTFGKAIWKEQGPVTPKHIFRIFSMTKMVTTVAALQLVEQGRIKLDDDLSKWLPEMSTIPILTNGKLVDAKNPITLRHLLTHTAGFGYTTTDEELAKFDRSNWQFKDLPRRFESGTQFLYGTSIDWAGRLIEKITGLTLENYFQKNICGPLGMTRTWFNVPDSLKPFIVSRGERGDNGMKPLAEIPDRIPSKLAKEFSGGGGLFSSPADFAKLMQCLLNYGEWNGVRILKKETVEAMAKNQIGNISMADAGKYFTKGLCCNFDGIISSTTKWGFGGLIDNGDKPYGRKAGTILWGGLMNTYFFIDYTSGIAASIYTQHLPFNHPATTQLFNRFSELIYSGK